MNIYTILWYYIDKTSWLFWHLNWVFRHIKWMFRQTTVSTSKNDCFDKSFIQWLFRHMKRPFRQMTVSTSKTAVSTSKTTVSTTFLDVETAEIPVCNRFEILCNLQQLAISLRATTKHLLLLIATDSTAKVGGCADVHDEFRFVTTY